MKGKFLLTLILPMILIYRLDIAQTRSDPYSYPVFMGIHNGNRIGISFYDDGQIAGFNTGVDVRGEWPLGSGENYIGDCIPLIGVEFVNRLNDTIHSVVISRGPRNGQTAIANGHPTKNYYWGWNPRPGFRNENYESPAMSHLPKSWPPQGWADKIAKNWFDADGNTQWYGYFGRGIIQADQESVFEADDQWDDRYNFVNYDESNGILFLPDSTDPTRHGQGLVMKVRGFQWSNFLAEDCLFWLYEIKNEGTTIYPKADFGTVVGTLAGGDGDSGDDLGIFDALNWVTYSYDNDGIGNHGQKVGYVGYAFLESPGNPFDGIDNDNDSQDESSPRFTAADFDSVVYNAGDQVVLINVKNVNGATYYERTLHTVSSTTDTVYSMGVRFIIVPGKTYFREGNIASLAYSSSSNSTVAIPAKTANDGIDNDLDGLVDENEATHYYTRVHRLLPDGTSSPVPALKHINYFTGAGVNDLMIDERRDNDIDEDRDWDPLYDDVGIDGVGPRDNNYTGPDEGEGNGIPDQGEPNFGRTDPDESDQIGLTGFNFFNINASPDLSKDTLVWNRMTPGRFDVISPVPQDGDFIYSSGYFPLVPSNGSEDIKERFSVSLLFGEDYKDVVNNKNIVQKIYNSDYKFPQPPSKPTITITQEDGKVVIYWDGTETETSRDFITKTQDFEGYKIYRATDASFQDSREITNAQGYLSFDKPYAQYDLVDSISGYFYPSAALLTQVGGTTFYLGDETGIVNRFVDSSVTKGVTYYYAVCSYDRGDSELDIFPTENSKLISVASTGAITTDKNTGYITPGMRPVGYKDAKYSDLEKSPNFIGTGDIEIEIIDDAAIKSGFSYKIAFQDTAAQGYTSNWSLIDLQTPDTVYIPITEETVLVNPEETITLPSGTSYILVNKDSTGVTGGKYTGTYDSLITRSTVFTGNTPIRHGFRAQIYNDAAIKIDTSRSGFSGLSGTYTPVYSFYVPKTTNAKNNGVIVPAGYEIEFFDSIVDTSVADTIYPVTSRSVFAATPVNFKVKNTTSGEYVDFGYWKVGGVSTTFNIYLKENFNGKYQHTWKAEVFYNYASAALESTGKLTLATFRPFSHNDYIKFTMESAEIDKQVAKNELDKIRVVPNPYVVTNVSEPALLSTQTSGRGERRLRFTYVPPGSKISIYTVRGEKIKTLTHDDLYVGDVYWNLRTEENLDVAYGVYIYVVEAEGIGNKVGKFALIK